MRPALKLGQTPLGMVVAVGLHAAGVVERNALIIAQRRTAGALVGILGDAVGPHAREIDLRIQRRAGQQDGDCQ